MTIRTTTSRALYAGNGVTTIFSFPYLFLANGDLEVRRIAVNGASTVLTLTTHYTVTGARNDAGGSVTMIVAPASGEQLLIRRIVDLTQETAYPSGDSFPAKSHERALDKLTMMVQQHDEELARTIQIPPESNVDASTINVKAVEVVAGIAAGVSAVAAIDAKVVIAANNIAAILAAPAQAAAAAASAVAAAASANAAAASAGSIALPLPTTSGGSGSNYADAAALFNGIKQAASTTETGVVELATDAEAQAGTDTSRAVTAANLKAAQIQLGTAVTLTTQTAVDFTGIPSWVKRVNVHFDAASLNGSSGFLVRLGDAGGFETTGYVAASVLTTIAATELDNSTSGFPVRSANAPNAIYGTMVIERSGTSNRWIATHTGHVNGTSGVYGSGAKTLSAELTQIRVTTINGTDRMDGGVLGISWE